MWGMKETRLNVSIWGSASEIIDARQAGMTFSVHGHPSPVGFGREIVQTQFQVQAMGDM